MLQPIEHYVTMTRIKHVRVFPNRRINVHLSLRGGGGKSQCRNSKMALFMNSTVQAERRYCIQFSRMNYLVSVDITITIMSTLRYPIHGKVRKRRLQSRPAMSTVMRLSIIKDICNLRFREFLPNGKSAYKSECRFIKCLNPYTRDAIKI